MLKRTPGIWDWTITSGKDNELKMVIVVKEEKDDSLKFDFAEEPLKPTVGDLQLVTRAPKMHELLYEANDEIEEALHQGVLTEGIYRIRRKISALLAEINVERPNPPCK